MYYLHSNITNEEFDRQYREIADQIKMLRKKRVKRMREIQPSESYEQRAQEVDGYMKKAGSLKLQFDEGLVRRLVQNIKVINGGKIEIQFKSGIVMKQDILGDD